MKLSKIVTALALLALPMFGAPVIESAVINTYLNQLTITGTDFDPSGRAPVVTLNSQTLTLVSSSNTTVVSNISDTILAGSYLLKLTNSAKQDVTFPVTVPSPNAGQFYSGTISLPSTVSNTYTLTGNVVPVLAWPSGGTILPSACTVDAVYVFAQNLSTTSTFTSIWMEFMLNGTVTDQFFCQVPLTGTSPSACPLPTTPFSVNAGDALMYFVEAEFSGTNPQELLSTSLRCR
jgi:hypothetical protein